MAYLNPNSFYSHYKAPRSAAFGGTLGAKPKPKALVAPQTAPVTPGGPAAAPAGVPQGFTVTPANLPPDPVYQQTMSGLGSTLTDTLSGLTQGRSSYLAGAGFTESVGADGKPVIAIDPNNPYSQAALLKQNYANASRGDTNSYAASGQLYSGSLQNAQNATTDSYNRGENGLESAVINFLANNTIQQNTARDNYDTSAGQALGTSVAGAPNNPLYNPSASGTGGVYSTDANGNSAITAGAGGTALVPQQANSRVKLAAGWSAVLDGNGKVIKLIPPGG